MAYMNQERKNLLAPAIKAVLKKYGIKATLSVDRHSLSLNIKSGPIDFFADCVSNANNPGGYMQVNTHWTDEHYTGVARSFLREVIDAMKVGNWDRSDSMSDYFDVGWYVHVNVGKWNKPYAYIPQ